MGFSNKLCWENGIPPTALRPLSIYYMWTNMSYRIKSHLMTLLLFASDWPNFVTRLSHYGGSILFFISPYVSSSDFCSQASSAVSCSQASSESSDITS